MLAKDALSLPHFFKLLVKPLEDAILTVLKLQTMESYYIYQVLYNCIVCTQATCNFNQVNLEKQQVFSLCIND